MMKRRIFIAIGLTEEVHEIIIGAVKRWQWLPIRWLPPQNWHLTVIPPFYATDEELAGIELVIIDIARTFKPFTLSFNSIILAPPDRKARMLWLYGPASKELQKLKEMLERGIVTSGVLPDFKNEERQILPHITLARFEEGGLKQIEDKTRVLEKLPITLEVTALDIMESLLKITGVEYEIIKKIPLGEDTENEVTPFEFLPHTADLRIRAKGKTLEELFQNALRGMSEYMKDKIIGHKPTVKRLVEITASDHTTLLVDFISEALALSDANQELYTAVTFEEFSKTDLRATLRGVPVKKIDKDIKAVTYHGADIQKTPSGYEVIVIYDI